MLQLYLPILIFLGVGVAFGLAILTMGWLMSVKRPNKEKLSPSPLLPISPSPLLPLFLSPYSSDPRLSVRSAVY